MNKGHLCEPLQKLQNQFHTVEIIQCDEYESGWFLRISSYANEKMVKDGEAEEVGDFLCSYELSVSFCPFCGLSLTK